MKELSFDRMEKIDGGTRTMSYCNLLEYWLITGDGYQGSHADLRSAWEANCTP